MFQNKRLWLLTPLYVFLFSVSTAQENSIDPPFINVESPWIDSLLSTMTIEQKIAQLIMYPVYSKKNEEHVKSIEKLVEKHQIGGLIYMQGGPVRQVNLNNRLQALSKIPLLTSIDGEWGVSMRLDSVLKFPRQMLLGAVKYDSLIYEMGAEIARQCSLTGVHINFAPVVDINVNPKNPVINSRSFGENKELVSAKSLAYMQGLQDNGVLASAKHFPGHGDTDKDSHYDLPTVTHSAGRIDSVELYPYRSLIAKGLGSVMVAHLYVPSLDDTKNLASSLSPKVVQGLLKDSLGFNGLAITDALNMKGVSKYYNPGEVDLLALLAGNDILLFSENVGKAVSIIKKAVARNKITEAEINAKCKKILQLKKWLKLDSIEPLSADSLVQKLNSREADVLNRRLVQNAITLLKNDSNIIPIKGLNKLNIACLSIGGGEDSTFQKEIEKYGEVKLFSIGKNPSKEQEQALLQKLEAFNMVIIGVHGSVNPSRNFGVSKKSIDLMKQIDARKKTVIAWFANPYGMGIYEGIETLEGLVMGYQDNVLTNQYAAQLIFGGIPASGALPVSAGVFKEGTGLSSIKTRLKYGVPEEEGFNFLKFKMIDSIAISGITEQAYPGCQVLVAKNGNVVYNKSFGYHTYEKKIQVSGSDMYDIASVTKVTATVPSLMKLVGMDKISLDDNLCYHLDYVDSTGYLNMNLRDMLAHTAGLVSTIFFYTKTLKRGQLDYKIYSTEQTAKFPYRVAEELFVHKSIKDSIRKWTVTHGIHKKREYRYSDVGFYFYKDMIEKYFGKTLDAVADSLFYQPLGATRLTYNPRNKYEVSSIPPTENDMIFRKRLIHGDVHDQGASMMGGVAGHAGLFSNANDLAKMFQMYINWGEYGGEKYLEKEVIKDFVKCQFCEDDNRRGAGFDRRSTASVGPTCNCVSWKSFGHTGFTGTMAWADPEEDIVYIFLSNRIYPDADNKKLMRLDIRTNIQQVIYDSLAEDRKKKLLSGKSDSISAK
jgi:beta-N-acetylhexosaminidase